MQLGSKSVNQFFPLLKKCVRLFSPLGMRVHFFVLVINKTRKKNGFVVRFEQIFSNWKWVTLKYGIGWVCSINITLLIMYIEPVFSHCNVQLFVVIAVAISPLDFLFFLVFNSNILLLLCLREFMHTRYVFPHPPTSLFNFFRAFHNICDSIWCVCLCVAAVEHFGDNNF